MVEPIPIGLADGRGVRLGQDRRATHLHVIGASGQGKSKFLEHCIREDILKGHGVCLIDPEGDLYSDIVDWCALHQMDRTRKIHLFDPTETGWRFRFNPLHVHEWERGPRHRIDNVIEALAQVWGGEDSRNTPAIRTTLRAIFSALISQGYTMAEAFYLTSTHDPSRIAQYLSSRITNPIIKEIWDGYIALMDDQYSQREHAIEFGGSRRRFSELLGDNEIRETLAAYTDPIDFKKCMDDGDVVLINLSPEAMGDDPARAFGALFVREMFYCASRRDPKEAQDKPFFAYIDECGEFLTRDISRILARSRKRGLHVILAHQWLQQLKDQGESIYHGVMGVQNKIVFGGISDEDAGILADQIFRDEYDLEIPINALTKPGVVGYERIWLNNWSRGQAHAEVEMQSEGTVTTESSSAATGTGTTVSQIYDTDGYPTGAFTVSDGGMSTTVDAHGVAQISTTTTGTVDTESEGHGASEALAPILEDVFGGVHSLENVRHMAIARLRSIPPRNAVVKGAATPSFDITTYDVEEPVVPPENVEAFKQRVLSSSPYTILAEVAQDQLIEHEKKLRQEAFDHVPGEEPKSGQKDEGGGPKFG